MFTYEFDICTSTHEYVKQGVLCTQHMLATIMADTFQEADLTASQMAYGHTFGGMVTKTRVRI